MPVIFVLPQRQADDSSAATIVKVLLDSHAEPNHTDDETNTALHCAASSLRCAPFAHTLLLLAR